MVHNGHICSFLERRRFSTNFYTLNPRKFDKDHFFKKKIREFCLKVFSKFILTTISIELRFNCRPGTLQKLCTRVRITHQPKNFLGWWFRQNFWVEELWPITYGTKKSKKNNFFENIFFQKNFGSKKIMKLCPKFSGSEHISRILDNNISKSSKSIKKKHWRPFSAGYKQGYKSVHIFFENYWNKFCLYWNSEIFSKKIFARKKLWNLDRFRGQKISRMLDKNISTPPNHVLLSSPCLFPRFQLFWIFRILGSILSELNYLSLFLLYFCFLAEKKLLQE
mgnify:CR=1 FL=1